MATPDGWTIISQPEENNNAIVRDSGDNAIPSISDYFEVVDDLDQKCKLCSRKIRLGKPRDLFNLRRHFKLKHHDEWTKIEPLEKSRKYARKTNTNANAFMLISSEEAKETDCPEYFDEDYGNSDSNSFDQAEMTGVESEMVDAGNFHAHPGGIKRAKVTHSDVDGSMIRTNGDLKDEITIFGEFIMSEMRNMKTDQFRGELKRAFTKFLLDVTEREAAAMAAKREE